MKPVDLFALTGRSVEDRVAGIARTARTALDALQRADTEARERAGKKRRYPALIGRWAARHLDLCVRTFECLPPIELVELIQYLLPHETPYGKAAPRGWHEAARHKARYPDASLRAVANAAGVSQTQIAKFLKTVHFQKEVKELRIAVKQGWL